MSQILKTNRSTEPFNHEMLIVARESRGLTQKELANRLDVNQGWLSRVESGLRPVSKENLQMLSKILEYPIDFFTQPEGRYGFGSSELFNRKRHDVPVKKLRTIHAQLNIKHMHIVRLLRGLEIEVNIPNFEIDDFGGSIKNIARLVRARWQLPQGPIVNLTNTIEDNGGIIIPYDYGTPRIDATSISTPEAPPLFFINNKSPGDRLRFTLCHELAHIIMHQKNPNPDMEKQADLFAAEFLMPEEDIRPFLKNISLSKLCELKVYWKVSMAALLKRASDLGEISERESRNLWIKMSKHGYRTKEPPELDIPLETPSLLQEIIDIYRNDLSYSPTELSKILKLNEEEVRYMYLNEKRRLRLIK